ncbi:MAG: radical SAM protein [Candidatus Latescibacteria bacterium]|nr:radical SAM protein [Candidatus Latescibacterota bacterium]
MHKPRPYRSIVIESTDRCNLLCVTCPRLSYDYKPRDLSMDAFRNLIPTLKNYDNVDLTGWGEPLLHKGLFEMIDISHDQGCTAGFISNGTLLDDRRGRKLLEHKVNWMFVSIDGADPGTFSGIRVGGDLGKVVKNCKHFVELRDEYRTAEYNGPFLSTTFTMNRANMPEVPDFVELASDIGFDQIHIKNQDVVSKTNDVQQILFPFSDDQPEIPYDEMKSKFAQARLIAEERGTRLLLPTFEYGFTKTCNPMQQGGVYIAATGEVSPCVNLGHPTPRMMPDGSYLENTGLIFGNVHDEGFDAVWNSAKWTKFRSDFESEIVPEACEGCQLLRKSEFHITDSGPKTAELRKVAV